MSDPHHTLFRRRLYSNEEDDDLFAVDAAIGSPPRDLGHDVDVASAAGPSARAPTLPTSTPERGSTSALGGSHGGSPGNAFAPLFSSGASGASASPAGMPGRQEVAEAKPEVPVAGAEDVRAAAAAAAEARASGVVPVFGAATEDGWRESSSQFMRVKEELDEAVAGGRADTPLREIGTDTPALDERQCRICLGGPEDEIELGRLISPCLCSGSMRYVHVKCINQWRGTGTNAKWFMECPQCHHQYRIQRTLAYGLATSRPILVLLTVVIFLLVAWLAGHMILHQLWKAALAADEAEAAAKVAAAAKEAGQAAAPSAPGSFWSSEDGQVVVYAGGATFVLEMIEESVDTFIDLAGRAYDAWSLPLEGPWGWLSTWALKTVIRLILGMALLGSLSFLSLLASLSLFAPLQLMHTLRGTGMFEGFRRRMQASGQGSIIIIVFVVIGLVNSIVTVYDVVQALTLRGLKYVETQILEVNPEEQRRAAEATQPGWGSRWLAERRWRSLRGWYEILLRFWLAGREWARALALLWGPVEPVGEFVDVNVGARWPRIVRV